MRKIVFIIFILFTVGVNAQQDPQFSHNMFNLTELNPANSGLNGSICTKLISRQQWVGLEGSPNTTLFTADAKIDFLGISHGVGISIIDDRLGLEKNFNAAVNYAYHQILPKGILSIGTSVGIQNKAFDGEWLEPQYEGNLTGSDPAIPTSGDQNSIFDVDLGLMYHAANYYLGLSVTHLTQQSFKFSNIDLAYQKRHYYLLGGYNVNLASSFIDIQPSFLIKTDGNSSQFSFNVNALYNKKIWLGVTYRAEDAMIVLAGIELINGLKIGYAYDLVTSKLKTPSSGSHEIMLGYCFEIGLDKKSPQRYKSVRFL